LIRPVLLYSSETWVLTKKEENRLLVFKRKVLHTIDGPKIVDGVYRSKYNFELDREFNSPNVIGAQCGGYDFFRTLYNNSKSTR
jgi:hypothetical protein